MKGAINTMSPDKELFTVKYLDQLPKGAFLTVKSDDIVNTMTIGWGSIGFMWQKPVLMVMVRYSRYTHELLQNAQDFSVSVPPAGELKKALAIAGTKSGRDIDKFKECSITAQAARSIDSPVIGECELFYECRLLYRQGMEPANLCPELRDKFYADDNYHVIYYGEITECYSK